MKSEAFQSKAQSLKPKVANGETPRTEFVRRYALRTTILQRLWLERLRQRQLLREGKILFDCASPIADDNRKLRALVEEVGEVAQELDRCEAMPTNARNDLRNELVQTAAVCIAWLEALEVTLDSRLPRTH